MASHHQDEVGTIAKVARGVVGLLLVAWLFSTFAAPALVPLLSRDRVSILIDDGGGRHQLPLPPTAGSIEITFEPDNATVASRAVRGTDGVYLIERCSGGCNLVFELDEAAQTTLTIEYLAGDSEYVDDIADAYDGTVD